MYSVTNHKYIIKYILLTVPHCSYYGLKIERVLYLCLQKQHALLDPFPAEHRDPIYIQTEFLEIITCEICIIFVSTKRHQIGYFPL